MGFYRNTGAEYQRHLLSLMKIKEMDGNTNSISFIYGDKEVFEISVVGKPWYSGVMGVKDERHWFKYSTILEILKNYEKEPKEILFIPAFDGSGNIQVLIENHRPERTDKYDLYIISNCDLENWVV